MQDNLRENSRETEKKILSLMLDIVFKLFFTKEENLELLADLLQSILSLPDDEIAEIQIINPHINRGDLKSKEFSEKYHEVFLYRNESGHILTGHQQIHVLDLTKAPKEPKTDKDLWMQLFRCKSEEEKV